MSDRGQTLDELKHHHDIRNARLAKLEALHEALMICADIAEKSFLHQDSKAEGATECMSRIRALHQSLENQLQAEE
jgi:hypothetical protein